MCFFSVEKAEIENSKVFYLLIRSFTLMIATATTTLRSLNVTVNKLSLKVLAIKNFSHLAQAM